MYLYIYNLIILQRNDSDTSTCELVESNSELLNINLVINSDEESILFLLDLYLANYNERDLNIVYIIISIIIYKQALTKYYCDEFNPENITTVVITSCSMEKQQQFLKENPDLLLISVVDKSGDTCDNRMYIYIYII